MKRVFLFVVVSLSCMGCERAANGAESTESAESAGPTRYTTRGRIEGLTPMRADIAHEDVPGYMPPMTMPFFAKEEGQLTPFTVGDSVEFTFEVQEAGRHEIVEITKR